MSSIYNSRGISKTMISNHVASILDELNIPKDHPDFKDTPERIERMYAYFFTDTSTELSKLFSKRFPSDNNEMITFSNITAHGLCPHHLLPVSYNISVGYIPDGTVIGLSKVPRAVKLISRYPDLQENVTTKIMNTLRDNIQTDDVMVVLKGVHDCMRCRGVESYVPVTTSAISGAFVKQPVRDEFLRLMEADR